MDRKNVLSMLTRNKIIRLADRKMKAGEKKYGIWNPKTDKRKLRKEMVEELVDVINYAIMEIQKLTSYKPFKQ